MPGSRVMARSRPKSARPWRASHHSRVFNRGRLNLKPSYRSTALPVNLAIAIWSSTRLTSTAHI